jgi:hypothetical protein
LPGHPQIRRVPARELAPDSDLAELPVTTAVGELTGSEINEALAAGVRAAESVLRDKLICAAALRLQGETRVVGSASEFRELPIPVREGGLAHA